MADNDGENVVYTQIHRSLTRPDLVFGCERGPIVFLFATSAAFIGILQKPLTIIIGILFIVLGIPILRWAARRDPNMYRVWSRHFSYQNEYSCHPSLSSPPPNIIDQQRKKGSTA